jgi:hypothetical protein
MALRKWFTSFSLLTASSSGWTDSRTEDIPDFQYKLQSKRMHFCCRTA